MAKTNVLVIGLLSKFQPVTIDDLNNGQGTFLYNHNAREVLIIENEDGSITVTDDESQATGTGYQYDSCRVEYPRTADNMYRTLLNAKYDSDHQEKLINEYNSAKLGLMDESKVAAYTDFLRDRIAIRAMVDQDADANNIPKEEVWKMS